jgi:predicted transcriptional regulator
VAHPRDEDWGEKEIVDPGPRSKSREELVQVLVRDVMTSPAITVHATATIKDAIGLLERHSIAAMPVLDEDGDVVGVISEADVIRGMVVPDQRAREIPVRLTAPPFHSRVADVMSNFALTVSSDTELATAADLITSSAVKSLPVIDRGQVVGVISRRDIIRLLSRSDPRIEAEIDELFRQSGQDWLVDVTDGIAVVDGPTDDHERELAKALVCTVPGVIGVHFASARIG